MAQPVQLAPGSLALVLCRLQAQEEAEGAEEPGGRAVFRAFRRANARCFWNSRLARATSRLAVPAASGAAAAPPVPAAALFPSSLPDRSPSSPAMALLTAAARLFGAKVSI